MSWYEPDTTVMSMSWYKPGRTIMPNELALTRMFMLHMDDLNCVNGTVTYERVVNYIYIMQYSWAHFTSIN